MNETNQINVWPVQTAKARFSEMLKASISDGPQTVSLHGTHTAVLVSLDHWRTMQGRAKPSLKGLLMQRHPVMDELNIPARGSLTRRAPRAF